MTQEAKLRVVVDGKEAASGSRVVIENLEGITHAGDKASKSVDSITESLKKMASSHEGIGSMLKTVISLTAIIEAGKTVFNITDRVQGFVSTMSVVTGSVRQAREELDYLFSIANKWGANIEALTNSYAKLSAAAMGTTLQGQGIRDIFESITKAGVAMHLSTQDLTLVFFALQQMVSKGRVSMEELRKQLAERFPGTMQMAAEAMGTTVDGLEKMIRAGKLLTEDFLPKFSKIIGERFHDAAVVASTNLRAEWNKLINTFDKFLIVLSESGAIEAASSLIRTMTEIMSNQSGVAVQLSTILSRLFGYVEEFLKNLTAEDIESFFTALYEVLSALVTMVGALVSAFNFLVDALRPVKDAFMFVFEGPLLAIKQLFALVKVFRGEMTFADWAAGQEKLTSASVKYGVSNDDARDKILARMAAENMAIDASNKAHNAAVQAYQDSERNVSIKTKEITATERLRDLDITKSELKAELSDRDITMARKTQILTALISLNKEYGTVAAQANKEAETSAKAAAKAYDDFNRAQKAQYADAVKLMEVLKKQGVQVTENRMVEDLYAASMAVSTIAREDMRKKMFALLETQIYLNNANRVAAELETYLQKAYEDEIKSLDKKIETSAEAVRKQKEENEAIGQTAINLKILENARIDAEIATLEATLATKQSALACTEESEKLKELIQNKKDLRALNTSNIELQWADNLSKATGDGLKKTATEFEKMGDSISDTISDALMRGFEDGKSFAKNFRDVLLNMFKTNIMQPAIKAIIGGIFGGSGSAFAGGGGGVGGGAGLFGGLSKMVGGFSNPFGAGFSLSNNQWGGGVQSPEGGLPFFSTGDQLGQAAAGAGTGFAIGSLVSSFVSERRKTGAQVGGTIGGAIGSIWGPIGAMIGSALGSLVGSLFKSGGGVKTEGSASSRADVKTGQVDKGDMGRLFTLSTADAEYQKVSDSIATGYIQAARGLGIKAGTAQFSIGGAVDPKGDAGTLLSAQAMVGDRVVYNAADIDVGRDPAEYTARIALETKRMLFAAIQGSDLPTYLSTLFDSVKVSEATEADITKMLDMGAALQTAVKSVISLQPQLEALDASQLEAFVDVFGGAQAMAERFAFIGQNFTTDADKLATVQAQLTDGFAGISMEVPKTHTEFMALLGGLNLTTEAGRATYEVMTSLAPAFVTLNGTAQQATEYITATTEAFEYFGYALNEVDPVVLSALAEGFGGMGAALDSIGFLLDNFYTNAQRGAADLEALNSGFDDLGLAVPETHAGFLEILNGLNLTIPAERDMYVALMRLAGVFVRVNGTAQDAAESIDEVSDALSNVVDLGSIGKTMRSEFDRVTSMIDDTVGQMSGTMGDQLSLKLTMIAQQIDWFTSQLSTVQAGSGEYQGLMELIDKLKDLSTKSAGDLAKFILLSAQYGPALAEQRFELEKWRDDMLKRFAGNQPVMDAILKTFDDRWKEILEGISGGVENTLTELERIKESLRQYLKDIALRDDISPLSPSAKLAAAQKDYLDLLGRAQGGDIDALRDLQGAADAYLKVARDMFASTSDYNRIWQSVVSALTALAAPAQTGGPEPNSNDAVIAAAMPRESPIASQQDIQNMHDEVAALLRAIAKGTRDSPETIVQALETTAAAAAPRK